MQVGDLVYVKGARHWGVALITAMYEEYNEYHIQWTHTHPERHTTMWMRRSGLEPYSTIKKKTLNKT